MLDFWLIGVYTELDVKGNLFSGRKLMLQAIRANPGSATFLLEYLRFEVRFLEKVHERIQILNGGKEAKLDFIDDEQEEVVDEGRLNGSSRLVEIVFENLREQFGSDLDTMR